MSEKKAIASKIIFNTVALNIYDILYGIEDKIVVKFTNEKKYHTIKIHYETKIPYFRLYDIRYRLDEFIKC